jgi:hypothetical protein
MPRNALLFQKPDTRQLTLFKLELGEFPVREIAEPIRNHEDCCLCARKHDRHQLTRFQARKMIRRDSSSTVPPKVT